MKRKSKPLFYFVTLLMSILTGCSTDNKGKVCIKDEDLFYKTYGSVVIFESAPAFVESEQFKDLKLTISEKRACNEGAIAIFKADSSLLNTIVSTHKTYTAASGKEDSEVFNFLENIDEDYRYNKILYFFLGGACIFSVLNYFKKLQGS